MNIIGLEIMNALFQGQILTIIIMFTFVKVEKVKDLPADNPMRIAVPAIASYRKQLYSIVNNKIKNDKE